LGALSAILNFKVGWPWISTIARPPGTSKEQTY